MAIVVGNDDMLVTAFVRRKEQNDEGIPRYRQCDVVERCGEGRRLVRLIDKVAVALDYRLTPGPSGHLAGAIDRLAAGADDKTVGSRGKHRRDRGEQVGLLDDAGDAKGGWAPFRLRERKGGVTLSDRSLASFSATSR